MSRKICLFFFLLALAGCGTSKTPTQPSAGLSGNWVMKAQDSHGATFQVTGVAQTTQLNSTSSQNIAMANLRGSSSQAGSSCSPYRIALASATVSGSTFGGSFTITSKSGERVNMNVNAQVSPDGFSLSSGTYTLDAAPPACFTAAATGSFSGYQIPEVTGNWIGTIQPCSWNAQTHVCSKTGFVAEISATLTQDDVAATVSGTYKITGSPTFSTGNLTMLGSDILSGQTLQSTLRDANGAIFVMDGQLGRGGSVTGVVVDAAANYYYFQMLQQ